MALTLFSCTTLLSADSPSPSTTSIPDYMERWEFGIDINEDQGPRYFVDPIVPLYQHASDTGDVVFLEPRMTYRDREWLLNLGGGYRRLVLNRAWMLGGNMFYDYESEHAHSRVGLGAEALSSFAELRSNVYIAASGERAVEENSGGITFERAVDGFDMEVGAPVPYYSRVKLFGGFNWYDQPHFKNRYGWTLRTEYKPVPFIVIDGTVSDDTKTNVDWGMKVVVRIPLGGNVENLRSPVQLDPTMFPESDASAHVFDLVERHHEIVVERRLQTGAVSIQVTRGT
ncbi:MAG: inverse autotransporter beta domain-containing protein [Candidatus Omnitrophica bacterium]|nr:inverse autotransporter beta domain-containing protein [Candidatus Omnitrophota bacterium]